MKNVSEDAILITSTDMICINYHYKHTNFKLEHKITLLSDIFTVILMLINNLNYRERCYLDYFYDQIKNNVVLEDENGLSLSNLTNPHMLNPSIRQKVKLHPNSYSYNDQLTFTNMVEKGHDFHKYDYIFQINNQDYVIPEECFINTNTVSLNEVEKWRT